ncbi:cytochrome P450 724B1-like [Andrographis paniculata]|uniref:cytochrome P450 724B1-like n=1 Tax=Andrographis paniculata TaxID=175694 RepID=UPI0021E8348A|nr:cytochrome P450 724B1-like [Andrographis paniculata]
MNMAIVGGGWVVFVVVSGSVGFLVGVVILCCFLPLFLVRHPNIPKGSFGWPLVGETIAFLKPHPSTSTGAFLEDHCSRYGKVFKSHLFFSPTVVSCDQELNYYILNNEERLFKGSYPKPIHGILGKNSMLVAVGETHRRLRNVAVSLITTIKSKPDFLSDIENTAQLILSTWKGRNQVIFSEEARKYTFNVIVKQVLGLAPDEAHTKEILQDFLTFMKGLISLPIYIPGTPYARAVKARNRISSTVKAIIEERRRRKTSVDGNSRQRMSSDFLEILICVDTLSEDEKVSFVLDSLLGGYETTSLLLSMVVFFLDQFPLAVEQLKQEHQKIRTRKGKGEFLNWEDYKQMEFTHSVINEALRYGNIVKFVHRKAIKDVKFKEYIIPSGWKVLPVFSAVHLDSSLHAAALNFNPWRWKTQDQACKKFTPFGGGTRCCPGFELARVEVAFFLHHLLQSYRWKVEDGEQPIAYPYVEFRKGLKLSIESSSHIDS